MVCNQCLKFSFTLICQEKVRENKFNDKCLEIIIIAVGRMRQRLPSFPVLFYGVSPYVSL